MKKIKVLAICTKKEEQKPVERGLQVQPVFSEDDGAKQEVKTEMKLQKQKLPHLMKQKKFNIYKMGEGGTEALDLIYATVKL